jgi:Predicted esterase of the alpha-beta hydrolase superfamily
MQPGNPRSALVLGGGGILGAAYEIGVLAVLEERYGEGSILRTFDLFLGTSAGSFVAAVISQGIPPGRLFRAYRDRDPELLLRPQDVSRVRWGRLLSGALKFLAAVAGELAGSLRRLQRPSLLDVFTRGLERLPAGFLSIDRLDAYLCALFAREGLSNHFADLSRPLLIPAVDLDAGVVHVFGGTPSTTRPSARPSPPPAPSPSSSRPCSSAAATTWTAPSAAPPTSTPSWSTGRGASSSSTRWCPRAPASRDRASASAA